MKLGLHTYSYYLHGAAQNWGGFELPWPKQIDIFGLIDEATRLGLDGLHLDDGSLESLDSEYLKKVKKSAEDRGLYLEYNWSMDSSYYDIRVQHTMEEGLAIAKTLGVNVGKISMDLRRSSPLCANRFHPDVQVQLEKVVDQINAILPIVEAQDLRIAVENHTESFADEVLWVIDQVNHPLVGACVDTLNGIMITEDPMVAIEKLAPRSFTNHFKDARIELQRYGCKITGTAIGEGDIDIVRAYELIKSNAQMDRINIEVELETPLDDMAASLQMEKSAIERSVDYCRKVLGIQ